MNVSIAIEKGNISKDLDVPDLIIRQVNKYHLVAELDGFDEEEEEPYRTPDMLPKKEFRLQGRLINRTSKKLCDIKYDVSYYDSQGHFLGLDSSRLIDEDSMDIGGYLPLDMRVNLPERTEKCVFNVRSKQANWLDKFLG